MNRTTTSPSVCSRAILRCTHPNAKCIIAHLLPKYFLKLHQTAPTGPGVTEFKYLNFIKPHLLAWGKNDRNKKSSLVHATARFPNQLCRNSERRTVFMEGDVLLFRGKGAIQYRGTGGASECF